MSSATNCRFGLKNRIMEDVLISNTSLGDFTYIAKHTSMQNAQIGKFCCIGPNCNIGLGKHPSKNFVSVHPAFYSINNTINVSFVDSSSFEEFDLVEIGNDVWIGANAIIKDGVKIGNGAIVGAGSVITKDVDDYAIVGGVPAKLIRYRFTKQQIEQLLKIEWWNFDNNKLKNFSNLFENIDNFLVNINKLEDYK
jgi:acetyltransferase-like isoleucine patch superfamily enzyme